MILAPRIEDVEDSLLVLAMRCGLREVRKLKSEECDAELDEELRRIKREAKRRSRARIGRSGW